MKRGIFVKDEDGYHAPHPYALTEAQIEENAAESERLNLADAEAAVGKDLRGRKCATHLTSRRANM